ncbi:MAG: T9SS type A sorting domain-containing protein [Bacteroidetes bacterium]|nr:T9SS type A sorting domain-containing protein [Bacteroidota bacterium]HET6245491.1 T9SS type A sorting domain-containing protein [Bacteroidia bacterium]
MRISYLLSLTFILIFSGNVFSSGHTVTTTVVSNVSCNGMCNGVAYATVSGGVGPFQYQWNTNPVQNSQTISGLCAGTYSVVVTDMDDNSTSTAIVTITQPSVFFTSISPGNQTICEGQSVSLFAATTGGTNPYTFNWSPSTGINSPNQSTVVASPVSTTTYTVTITDAQGCTATDNVTITVNPIPLVSINPPQATICAGTSITLFGFPETGGGSFAWNTGETTSQISVSPNTPTTFSLQYTLNGCMSSASAFINVQNIFVSLQSTPATCNASDGSISLAVTGGSPPYSFLWSNGSTTQSQNNLPAGTYSVTVTDANGCSTTASSSVTNSGAFTLSGNVINASCASSCDGSIEVTVSGGTPPFTYLWTPSGNTVPTMQGLCPGNYSITVTDNSGCQNAQSFTVNSVSNLVATMVTNGSTCNGNTGSANVMVSGGTSPYSYQWNPIVGTGNTANNLSAGTYTVIVTDNVGCTFTTSGVVSNSSNLTVNIGNTSACSNGGGTANAWSSGGTPPYSYLWNNSSTDSIITNLTPGTYSVTVTDQAGCSFSISTVIQSNWGLYVSGSSTPSNCSSGGSVSTYIYGGTAPYNYSWNTVPVQTSSTAIDLPSGLYTVNIMDQNGCTGTGNFAIQNLQTNFIHGKIYTDLNGNCQFDVGEPVISNKMVIATGNQIYYGWTNSNGDYSISVPSGNYSVSSNFSQQYYQNNCSPNGIPVNFVGLCDTISSINIGVTEIPDFNNLAVYLSVGGANPGFTNYVWITAKNLGNTSLNAVVKLNYDSILSYINASPAPTLQVYPEITWNIPNFAPNQVNYYTIQLQMPTPANGGTLGDILNYTATIEPFSGDQDLSNNTANATRIVTGSYDPNEKLVFPKGDGPEGTIQPSDSLFTYTIFFQNTGTDTAFTVVVMDTIKYPLILETIELGGASHPYTFDVTSEGVLVWTFNQIMLVDSNANEPASHGFCNFRMKTLANLAPLEQIINTADIYFDFNPPIITNTVVNTIANPATLIKTENSTAGLHVFPNPMQESASIVIGDEALGNVFTISMYDVYGHLIYKINTTNRKNEISSKGLSNGIYFLTIDSDNGFFGKSKIVVTE